MVVRLWLVYGVIALALFGCWLRLVQLQVVRGTYYQDLIADDRSVVRFIPARRGKILDRWGVPLVDNRAVYHLALRLNQLELPSPQRYRVPFLVFDQQALDALLADLASRIALPAPELRRIVLDHLVVFPAVGQRRIAVSGSPQAQIRVLLPQSFAEDTANAQGSWVPADHHSVAQFDDLAEHNVHDVVWLPTTDIQDVLSSGLLQSHPLIALQQELRLRHDPASVVLTPAQFDRALAVLAGRYGQRPQVVQAVAWPFAHRLSLTGGSDTGDTGETGEVTEMTEISAVLVDQDTTHRLMTTLARLFGVTEMTLSDEWQRLLATQAPADLTTLGETVFVSEQALQRADINLPAGVQWFHLQISGLPGAKQRHFVIQDDAAADDGLCALLARRLAATLAYDADEMHRLLRLHGEVMRLSQLRRRYRRTHQIVFDPAMLTTFVERLSRALIRRGHDTSVLSLERAIAGIRAKADRGWAGETRRDAMPFVFDIDQTIAIDLDGLGAPQSPSAAEFSNTDSILPGLSVMTEMGRSYPRAGSASLIIGWLSRLSAQMNRREALSYGLDPMGWVGTQGLERVYDTTLQGVIGREVYLRESTGLRLLPQQGRLPQAGRDVVTTLDLELQLIAEQALENYLHLAERLDLVPEGRKGEIARQAYRVNHGKAGMVVIDCHSGAVLAMASTPRVDLSLFREQYRTWVDPVASPGHPLVDHSAVPEAPPGSTVKPMVALAALMEGTYQPDQVMWTPGYRIKVGNRPLMRDHPAVARDWTVSEAIQKSSNSFFAFLADDLGPMRLANWYRRFGLGQRHGVDTIWQRPGVLVTPRTVARYRPREPYWTDYDTWAMGIGQFMRPCASPLQLVTIPAVIANGGTIVRPYLWSGVADQAIAEQLSISPEVLHEVRLGMEMVTQSGGTARKLRVVAGGREVAIAAKTGTSEWGNAASRARGDTPDNSWLIGYAPADKPQVAFVIYLHATGLSGGRGCTGVAIEVLQRYFEMQLSRSQ